MLNVGTAVTVVLVPGWMTQLCSLMVWESRPMGMAYTGLHTRWGGSCASGNAEDVHKLFRGKSINYCRNPQDTFHMCEDLVLCSATLHR